MGKRFFAEGHNEENIPAEGRTLKKSPENGQKLICISKRKKGHQLN